MRPDCWQIAENERGGRPLLDDRPAEVRLAAKPPPDLPA